jgi:serine/threonine protein kinase
MAPEVMAREQHETPSDIFSFSMIMYELCTGHRPFPELKTATDFVQAIFTEKRRPEIPNTSGSIVDLIQQCWNQNPKDRPSGEIIVELIISGNAVFLGTEMAVVYEYLESLHLEEVHKSHLPLKQ